MVKSDGATVLIHADVFWSTSPPSRLLAGFTGVTDKGQGIWIGEV